MRGGNWFYALLPPLLLGLTMLAVIAGVIGVALFLLGPVSRNRTRLQAPTQFLLTDFFWLMVLIQESLAFVTQFVPKDQVGVFRLILGFLIFATIGIWIGGVNFMSQAGIRNIYHRALFQLVLLPGSLLAMIGLPAIIIITIREFALPDGLRQAIYIAWVSLILGAIFLRWLSTWIATHAMQEWGSEKSKSPTVTAG